MRQKPRIQLAVRILKATMSVYSPFETFTKVGLGKDDRCARTIKKFSE